MEVDDVCNQSFATLRDYRQFVSILPDYSCMPCKYDDFFQAFPECVSNPMHEPFCTWNGRETVTRSGFKFFFRWSFESDIESSQECKHDRPSIESGGSSHNEDMPYFKDISSTNIFGTICNGMFITAFAIHYSPIQTYYRDVIWRSAIHSKT